MGSLMNRTTSMVEANDPLASDRPGIGLTRARRLMPMVAAGVSTIWVFRPVLFSGRLLGDIGDARWTIALHEHWYRVLTGVETIRDLPYYFPLQKTLGTSDAFLVQGALYSIGRVVGFGLVNSWLIACIGFYLIGAIGVAVLSRQLLNGVAAQTAFTVTSCASYAVLIGFG